MSWKPQVYVDETGFTLSGDFDFRFSSLKNDCYKTSPYNDECDELPDFYPTKDGILSMLEILEENQKYFEDEPIFGLDAVKEIVRILTTNE